MVREKTSEHEVRKVQILSIDVKMNSTVCHTIQPTLRDKGEGYA